MVNLAAAADWTDAQRARALDHMRRSRARAEVVQRYAHPAQLLQATVPGYVITPAVELISREIERVLRGRRRKLMITAPPQEGKSLLCSVGTPLRALQLHVNWRVMLLTYADGLAEEHSRYARALIQEHGTGVMDALTGTALPDRLGLTLHPQIATASNWRIAEGDGGLVAAGRDATITGKRADLLIIDDPFKNMQEADSATMRQKVIDWYNSVATTRLAAGASIIFINTRWHPEDLSGHLLSRDRELPPHQREWRYVNIPAVSHPALPDALGRPPGVALVSARGRTRQDFAAIERSVGKRVWNALYQGSPKPPEGGLFSQAWFDDHRMIVPPERTKVRIVAIDPSESGEGDEAGIIGASLLRDNRVLLTHDWSFQATSDAWAKRAVDLALTTDATDIYIETYTAGTTYINVVKSNIKARLDGTRQLPGAPHVEISNTYSNLYESDPVRRAKLQALFHRVRGWRGTGDSVARSGLLRQAVEVGTCVVLGDEMHEFESQATLWQSGQHQPDRVAAAVIAHDRLVAMAGQVAHFAAPRSTPATGGNQWLARKVG